MLYFHQNRDLPLYKSMKFNPLPWLLISAILALSWWAKIQLIEQQELAFFCQGGGQTLPCKIRWLIVTIFHNSGIGFFVLFFGLLSAITRSGFIGLLAGVIGVACLLLHGGDNAAVDFASLGFLLGVLTLARAQFDEYRAQH